MCGRYTLATPDWVEADFSTHFPTLATAMRSPRYNVAPGQLILTLTRGTGGARVVEQMQWGIEAPWKGGPPQIINARDDKLAESRFWKPMVEARRCAIPADGFYEWKAAAQKGGKKQPFWFNRAGNEGFVFAGLYTAGLDQADPHNHAVIITVPPNDLIDGIFHRMPAMLRPEDVGQWLDGDADQALAALTIFPSTEMSARAVDRRVGNAASEGAELIAAVEPEPEVGGDAEPSLF